MPFRGVTDYIVVHCSATAPDQDIGAEEIRKWHVSENGWSDIGYHFVIRRNGIIEAGRHINMIGSHCKGRNSVSVGVCMVGGLNHAGTPSPDYTEEQWNALKTSCEFLKKMWPLAAIVGHNKFANKACPSFDVDEWVMSMGAVVKAVA